MFRDEPNFITRDFAMLARAVMLARGQSSDAEHVAENIGASPRVRSILRSLAGTTTTGSPGWGSQLADAGELQAAFFASLSYASAFDGMLAAMKRVPIKTRLIATTTAIAGSSPGEGETKIVSSLGLADSQLAIRKAQGSVVISSELARLAGQAGVDFIFNELRGACASSTDEVFVAAITSGIVPVAASGVDAESFRNDLRHALAAINMGALSRPYILMPSGIALGLSLMSGAAGGFEFPDLTAQGGSVAGIPTIVTDAAADADASPPTSNVVVADAAGLAGDEGEILLSSAEHATVNLGDDMPVNLWQNDLIGCRCERIFGAERARADAVAVISGAAYGQHWTSP